MKVLTGEEMRGVDRTAIQDLGIPGPVLMENAGVQVVKAIQENLGSIRDKHIAIFIGRGNNGGDGFVVARHIDNLGGHARIYLLSHPDTIEGDAKVNLDIISKMNIEIIPVYDEESIDQIEQELLGFDIIIDAILGTGIKGTVKGHFAAVIEVINKTPRFVIAVDIPSGLSTDTGQICGCCIHAQKTVTFARPKLGLLLYPGVDYVGELIIADIGIPPAIEENDQFKTSLITPKMLSPQLEKRTGDTHKGTYGKAFILAGSPGFTGAAALASQAALLSGAGLVTAGVPKSLNPILETKLTEVMTLPLPETSDGTLALSALDTILSFAKSAQSLAFGPGVSLHEELFVLLKELIKQTPVPMVIDADGLNLIAKNPDILKEANAPIILTPHPGEMARLVGTTIPEIQSNRLTIARNFAKNYQVILVLKGAHTLIARPDGQIFINTTGNPGMSSGGTGDVLTGLMAGLIAQKFEPAFAAITSVYLHGLAGDQAAVKKGERSLIASDLLEQLPDIIQEMEKIDG